MSDDLSAPSTSDQMELLRELALRLAAPHLDPRVDHPQLLLGEIPQPLPVALPIPEGSRVLGSLIHSPHSLQILLDVPLPEEEVRPLFQKQLTASGWQLLEEQEGLQRGGFTGTSPNRMVYTIYPSASENLSLRVHTVSFQPAPTGVRLSLYANDAPPARQRKGRRWRAPDSFEVFPPLSPPPGTRQLIGGGSGGGSDSSHSSATLELEQAIPIEEIQTHYNQQLQQAGWTSIDAGHVEQAAWSNWSFRDKDDEPWSGTFFLLKLAGQKPRYYLQLLAEWNVDRSGPFSGTRTGMNSQGWSYSS